MNIKFQKNCTQKRQLLVFKGVKLHKIHLGYSLGYFQNLKQLTSLIVQIGGSKKGESRTLFQANTKNLKLSKLQSSTRHSVTDFIGHS